MQRIVAAMFVLLFTSPLVAAQDTPQLPELCYPERHIPVPVITGENYPEARAMLIQQGWQPALRGSRNRSYEGFASELVEKGYWEVASRCGGHAMICTFTFTDVYGNRLHINTVSESLSVFQYNFICLD